ncbi:Ig-like domain-containing protein [Staphylococcus carnosus]|uniref:Similar to minor tail protein of phage phiSLT n=1 Tax=Staphylococcus carnosus (strain TM300) TaxID=396513 RepID=B9DJ01_STACT|nr:Ig-like domain-containing protein [Staphylococcus carnosus]QPT03595.1 Ig domain-containing protein [Staphylococcus carnosus]UQA66318.1 Ig-like domain-containing protein [Staphylococcus carnosus]UTB78843.1 phage tail protein [Staphylococcus carnosus]UTB88396.1 phage tail protein [Staphylococcus carnosus]UTB90744.1 phage tail protein [Staphylococcus carnosus]
MVKTLKVYKDDEVVGTQDGEGRLTVSVSGLNADTEYPKGTYQVAFEEDGAESDKVDVPTFKTNPILVTGISFSPNTKEIKTGADDSVKAVVAPTTATNKSVTYTSDSTDIVTVDAKTGAIHGAAEGKAVITAKADDGSGKTGTINITVTTDAV